MLKVIEHHSASAGNTFIDCPQMWIIDKLYGFETEENARMKMGHASAETAYSALENQITDEDYIKDFAKQQYTNAHQGNETDDECGWSGEIANRFVKELRQYGKIISYQKEWKDNYPGLKIPIIAKLDFEFEDYIVDTKATAKAVSYTHLTLPTKRIV